MKGLWRGGGAISGCEQSAWSESSRAGAAALRSEGMNITRGRQAGGVRGGRVRVKVWVSHGTLPPVPLSLIRCRRALEGPGRQCPGEQGQANPSIRIPCRPSRPWAAPRLPPPSPDSCVNPFPGSTATWPLRSRRGRSLSPWVFTSGEEDTGGQACACLLLAHREGLRDV